ncbi:MAG: class I SAM-dependent methyltransferase, partial [Rhodospirillaceae bacterium]|nr:class I SAM-dependent methyltransferase [Rhodospirillaceae bacterium]
MSNIRATHGHWAARTLKSIERFGGLLRTYNPISRAATNVSHHYDLSSTLYERFLDEDMQYSMAYYKSPNETLEQAQRDKVDHIAAKLCLKPGMSVLDVGCGWGGLGLALHQRHGVNVTGISLSEEQLKVANRRASEADVGDGVQFLYKDYREVEGTF